jgi:hypothetical protein
LRVGFLFPFPLASASVDEHRALGSTAPKFFQKPGSLHATQVDIQENGVGEPVGQKRFGLFDIGAMDDAIVLRIQCCANGVCKLGMLCEH